MSTLAVVLRPRPSATFGPWTSLDDQKYSSVFLQKLPRHHSKVPALSVLTQKLTFLKNGTSMMS